MPTALVPNVEKVVADYLRETIDARVVARTPDNQADSWVRLTMLDASAASQDHLIAFLVQLDCYAGRDGGQPEAMTLARDARASLRDMRDADPSDTGEVVVSEVRFVGMARIPDQEFTPDRERVILTARIWMHV